MTKCVSPWYNRTVWLGVKHQLTYLLQTERPCTNERLSTSVSHVHITLIIVISFSHRWGGQGLSHCLSWRPFPTESSGETLSPVYQSTNTADTDNQRHVPLSRAARVTVNKESSQGCANVTADHHNQRGWDRDRDRQTKRGRDRQTDREERETPSLSLFLSLFACLIDWLIDWLIELYLRKAKGVGQPVLEKVTNI